MKLQFTKMSGAGNDFVVIDNRFNLVHDGADLARRVCDRRWGIGADGLLLLQTSPDAAYRMMYFNADGSYGGMCGNGGRCIARFAVDSGIAASTHHFEALEYRYQAIVKSEEVVLSMKDPVNYRPNLVLRTGSLKLKGHFIDTGSPHFVIPFVQFRERVKSLEDIAVDQLGRKIRFDRLFEPEGTNVNFIERKKDNTIRMRTYERGVEAETLACGTGSIASAVISARLWKLRSPVKIVASSGITLTVGFQRADATFSGITLTGPAVSTFRGEINV